MSISTYNYWGSSDMVFQCLIDKKRVSALKKAILKTVKPGDVVVDLGTGTGIMSTFAIDAGAKKVYAVEADAGLCETFENNLKSNGYKGKIVLIEGDATQIKLPEKVDVVICEMVATGLIDESQVPVMNNVLQYCKPGAKIIISRMQNFVELVNINDSFYGHELQVIQYEYPWDRAIRSTPLSEKYMYAEIDFSKKNDGGVDVEVPLKINKSGKLNGIRITNKTFLADGSILGSTAAYCMPLVLPIDPVEVKKGEALMLRLQYKMCGGMDHFHLSLRKHETIMERGMPIAKSLQANI
ncbi:MAG: 50S ribosomal protein L11 methyltransferase [Candidatus Peregrinibacteria bacterium]|nr:50S ribosomal protein L11 methyltransferase [Candidatus Peregrinibacteria bacterium]